MRVVDTVNNMHNLNNAHAPQGIDRIYGLRAEMNQLERCQVSLFDDTQYQVPVACGKRLQPLLVDAQSLAADQ